jgi:hypothetical protein
MKGLADLDLALCRRFLAGAWPSSMSMSAGAADWLRSRLRPSLLMLLLRALAKAALASSPTLSSDA